MNRILIGFTIAAAFLGHTTAATAQEFKLPSLLPFRKTTPEVKPFHLTDQPRPRPGLFANGPLSGLLGRREDARPAAKSFEEWNHQTRSFFSRTGENISKFTSDTGKALKKLESPGWTFGETGHHWNAHPDAEALRRDLEQQGMLASPQPEPRTARQFGSGTPTHRF